MAERIYTPPAWKGAGPTAYILIYTLPALKRLMEKYHEECIVINFGKVRHSYASNKTPQRPWVLVCCNRTALVVYCTRMAGLAETFSHAGVVLH